MTEARPLPPASVPTLTEVVDAPGGAVAVASVPAVGAAVAPEAAAPEALPGGEAAKASAEPDTAPPTRAGAPAAAAVLPSESELVERILEDLQHQVDLVVEYRIRERLTPILERAGDVLVREARAELARSLREVVARAVTSELRRQRGA